MDTFNDAEDTSSTSTMNIWTKIASILNRYDAVGDDCIERVAKRPHKVAAMCRGSASFGTRCLIGSLDSSVPYLYNIQGSYANSRDRMVIVTTVPDSFSSIFRSYC